jgi:hypothetical protein
MPKFVYNSDTIFIVFILYNDIKYDINFLMFKLHTLNTFYDHMRFEKLISTITWNIHTLI